MEDLDDLFNEGGLNDQLNDHLNEQLNEQLNDELNGQLQEQLAIVSPAPRPPPGLAERIDELRHSGCADKISWSRIGSIAYITKDGQHVRVANLQFRSSDGTWQRNDYADATLSESVTKIYKGRQLVHVAWNPNQTHELLLADAHGRIMIGHVNFAINRVQGVACLSIDPEDSLNALVGLTWLNIKRAIPFSRSAQKINGTWKYSLQSIETRGPYGPANKSAFVAITRGGLVRSGYQVQVQQGNHMQFQEARKDLDGFSTSGDLITHAALCADKDDTLLAAIHTFSRQVRLYSIKIDWHLPKQGEQGQSSPTIDCQHLAVIDTCYPSVDPLATAASLVPELSYLHIVPRGPDVRGEVIPPPCILAGFTAMPARPAISDTSYTIISRWELREETPVLDVSFSQLGSKKSGASELKAEQLLKKLEDARIGRVLLLLQILHHGTMLALASYDGSIEFRSRDLSVLPMDDTPDKVSSLCQLGLAFNNREPCLHLALSPNAVAKAFFGKDHEIKTSEMHLDPTFVDSGGLATSDKLAAAFMIATAISEANNMGGNTNDDLLMTMQGMMRQMTAEQQRVLRRVFLKDLYTLFQFHEKLLEGLQSIERVIRPPQLCRCLSLQAALGDGGEKNNRTMASKVAYTALSMRNFALSSTMAFAKNATSSEQELNKPDVLQYLINLIAWFGTLADYICDQLLDLSRTLNVKKSFSLEAVKERVATLNTPVLHLVLSSFTRTLLRHNCRALRSIAPFTQSTQAQPGAPLHHLFSNLVAVFRMNIISPPIFENLLTESDAIVHKAYEGLSEQQKQETEFSILLMGEIPDFLSGAVQEILTSVVGKVRTSNANPMKVESNLAFKDWKILGLSDDPRSKLWRKQTRFDALRKIILPQNVRTRRCMRCDAVMEDILAPKVYRGGMVFGTMFRACFCGGNFVVDPPIEG